MNRIRYILIAIAVILAFIVPCCKDEKKQESGLDVVVGYGQMPNAANDESGNLHVVYGMGDSIMVASTGTQKGPFLSPLLVSVLPQLAASHMRGPQIAVTSHGLTIIACNNAGDIFSYKRPNGGSWKLQGKINDRDTVAKEGLMALHGDADMLYAVWLDLRDKHNKIFGSRSADGGHTWSKNLMIYTSPEKSVCECCKPSVIVKGKGVYVMFRNWLKGNRDLYLIQSNDGGLTFGKAEKLGNGNWALNGCPMDGGSLVFNNNKVQTIWNRKGKIYTCNPGNAEIEIGEGRSCTMDAIDSKVIYAWIERGEIVCLSAQNKRFIGKGQSPIVKTISKEQAMCIWEHKSEIHLMVLDL